MQRIDISPIQLAELINKSRQYVEDNTDLIKTEEVVHEMLEESENARCWDNHLVLRCLRKLGYNITFTPTHAICIFSWEELSNMRNWELFNRCRRNIQNTKGELLPKNIAILMSRRINEDHIKGYFKEDSEFMVKYSKHRYGCVLKDFE